jgi:hypothetical protein
VAAAFVALVNSEHVLGNALLKGPDTPCPSYIFPPPEAKQSPLSPVFFNIYVL